MAEEEVVQEKPVVKETKGGLSIIHLAAIGGGIVIVIVLMFLLLMRSMKGSFEGIKTVIEKEKQGVEEYKDYQIAPFPREGVVYELTTADKPLIASLEEGVNIAIALSVVFNKDLYEKEKKKIDEVLLRTELLHVCNIYFHSLKKEDFLSPTQASEMPEETPKEEEKPKVAAAEEDEWGEDEDMIGESGGIKAQKIMPIAQENLERHRRNLTRVIRDNARINFVDDVFFTSIVLAM